MKYTEIFPRRQDGIRLPDGDPLARLLPELVIAARCLGRLYEGGYEGAPLPDADLLIGEELATSNMIDVFLERKRQLTVTVGRRTLTEALYRGSLEPDTRLVIDEQRYPGGVRGGDPVLVDNQNDLHLRVIDFCRNLYFDGTVQPIDMTQ